MFFIILIIYDNNVQPILKTQTFFHDWYNIGTMDRLPLGNVIQINHATVMSKKVTRSLNAIKKA